MAAQVICVDWDSTCYDLNNDRLIDGTRDALDEFRLAGHKVMLFSCNNVQWLRMKAEQFNLHFDYIWGEEGLDGGKPVAAAMIDDRGIGFRGNWKQSAQEALILVAERPIKNYRGPVYRGNPKREAEIK